MQSANVRELRDLSSALRAAAAVLDASPPLAIDARLHDGGAGSSSIQAFARALGALRGSFATQTAFIATSIDTAVAAISAADGAGQ